MILDSHPHLVYLLYYPLSLVVKYRRKLFDDEKSNDAGRENAT